MIYFAGYQKTQFRSGLRLYTPQVYYQRQFRNLRLSFGKAQDAVNYGRRVVARFERLYDGGDHAE